MVRSRKNHALRLRRALPSDVAEYVPGWNIFLQARRLVHLHHFNLFHRPRGSRHRHLFLRRWQFNVRIVYSSLISIYFCRRDLKNATGYETQKYLKLLLKYVSPVLVAIITVIKFNDAQPIKYGDVEVQNKARFSKYCNKQFSVSGLVRYFRPASELRFNFVRPNWFYPPDLEQQKCAAGALWGAEITTLRASHVWNQKWKFDEEKWQESRFCLWHHADGMNFWICK